MKDFSYTDDILALKDRIHHNRGCSLIITQACNLHCSYCFEKFKTGKKMTLETAKNCLQSEIKNVLNDAETEWLSVELFGGEPLLNFPLIRDLVAWVRSLKCKCPIMFYTISNGTLLNEEIKSWARANKDMFVMGVSYDGSENSQHENRNASVLSALEFCHQEWPDASFRMTISPQTLPSLADDIKNSANMGYILRIQLAKGLDWTEENRILFESQLRIIKSFYMGNPDILPTMLPPLFTGREDGEHECIQHCGAKKLTTCYDVDGTKYPCHMFTPLSSGLSAVTWENYDHHNPANHNDPYCSGCSIKHWCYTCPAHNNIHRGHPSKRDHGMCRMNLTHALVTTEFQS